MVVRTVEQTRLVGQDHAGKFGRRIGPVHGSGGADVAKMAQAITESGYPAKTLKVFSAEEIRKERDLAASKSKYYVASVSGYDIARAEVAYYDKDLERAIRKQSASGGGCCPVK